MNKHVLEPARRNIESPTPPPASSITHKALKDIVQHEKQSQREHQKLIESEVKNHKVWFDAVDSDVLMSCHNLGSRSQRSPWS